MLEGRSPAIHCPAIVQHQWVDCSDIFPFYLADTSMKSFIWKLWSAHPWLTRKDKWSSNFIWFDRRLLFRQKVLFHEKKKFLLLTSPECCCYSIYFNKLVSFFRCFTRDLVVVKRELLLVCELEAHSNKIFQSLKGTTKESESCPSKIVTHGSNLLQSWLLFSKKLIFCKAFKLKCSSSSSTVLEPFKKFLFCGIHLLLR